MSPPPAKRQRAEEEPITCSELWISDGNVVLQAGNVQFRVHFGVLARHSSVFRDMQGLPQPSNEPNVDGCPVVQLPDDPTDIEYLLKALYDPAFLTLKAMPFLAIRAFIRLGRKYEFKDFLNLAVGRLTVEFPNTLEAFDALESELQTIAEYPGVFFDILALASENNILSVLPAAYFFVIDEYTLDELFEGIKKADGTMATLSPLHLHNSVAGREKLLLRQFQSGYTLEWVLDTLPVDGCTAHSKCCKEREMLMREFVNESSSSTWILFRASTLMAMCQLCTACNLHATKAIDTGRTKMWAELPRIFGLSPWDELTNDI
ncbi:BTB domain-containing protein [Mycena sanguinolenta]|uniref:BTB domain-containing protein n=1 Tax=Mycena sanguinolenta TaxID=230812 RepID=A0A8H6Z0I1_9AGAR|nr:BTB domain-containing protein [Mycena sanguinolenta]